MWIRSKLLAAAIAAALSGPALADGIFNPSVVAVTPGSSAIVGGTNTRVLFDDSAVVGESAGFTFAKTTGQLSLTGVTNTTSNPVLNLSQTWNGAGATFTAILMNVTNTASASGSMLMDLQIAATSVFNFSKNGLLTIAAGTGGGGNKAILADPSFSIGYSGVGHFTAAAGGMFEFGSSGINSPDTGISRNAASVVEINNGTPGTFAALKASQVTTNTAAAFHATGVALTNGAGVATGTLTTAPSAGNPTKWIGINDNGTTRYIPAW